MSVILGTRVPDRLVPRDTGDTYPTHDEQYGLGGFRSVASLAHRDAVPMERRKAGMEVKVLGDDGTGVSGRVFSLADNLETWIPLTTAEEQAAFAATQDAIVLTTVGQRLDAQQTAQQVGDADVLATVRGSGALPGLLTFAQVGVSLGGDTDLIGNLNQRLAAQQTARQAGDADVLATVRGDGALPGLLSFAQVGYSLGGDTNFAGNVAASFNAEAQARRAFVGNVPEPLSSLEKLAGAIAGDPQFWKRVANLENPPDPATFDAGSSAVSVPAGAMPTNGSRTQNWPAATVTSPKPATATVPDFAIAAGVNVVTRLDFETIVSVTGVVRASDGAPMALGTDYSIDMSRGLVTNLSGLAMKMTYVGGMQRKDVVSINVTTGNTTPVITLGAERKRTSEVWANPIPAGHMEIGRISRRQAHAFYIPRQKWRNGVHLDRLAEDAAQLAYNRSILGPIISRFVRGLPVRFVVPGNSRVAMGMFGNPTKLNTNPNSHASSDPTQAWSRDAEGFHECWDTETLYHTGVAPPVQFDETVGYNLPAGTPDGFAYAHMRQGYVWALLKALHARYPDAIIEYRNWGIAGSNSGADAYNGLGNALYPERWEAVQADIIPGQTLFIPVDPMNELGSPESYANWVTIAKGAQARGAVVHFMGNSRDDFRFDPNSAIKASFSAQEMARAAWDTGSAVSDAWRLCSPLALQGLGLHEDEIASANMANHEGTILADAIGQDAARCYA